MRAAFDTNIALYAFADVSNPAKTGDARQLLEDLRIRGEGVISTQVLKEFANVCTRKLRPYVSETSLFTYLNILSGFTLISVKTELIQRAVLRHYESKISFYDALHVESAIAGGVEVLSSEDLQHGMRFGGVHVVNPFR
jgi:predicted nucleic acid-binding protein